MWDVVLPALIGLVFAYMAVVWLLALVDVFQHAREVWQAAGRSQALWLLALVVLPGPAAFHYWGRARPELDRHTPVEARRPAPRIVGRTRIEERLADWDAEMRSRPWTVRWGTALLATIVVVLAISVAAGVWG